MKIYVKAAKESYQLPYNYGYAGLKPTKYMDVSILGSTIGRKCVFYVQNPNNTWGYFWGEAPKTTLNLFGEFAMRLTPGPSYESSLGLDISNLSSDSQIINAVNARLLEFVNNDIADTFADIFSIDWASCEWKAFSHCIGINVPGVGDFVIYDTAGAGNFVPQPNVFIYMIENDISIPDTVKKFVTYKEAVDHIAYKDKIRKVKATPYPEGITDEVADAIYEFHKFIYREKLGNASNLESAEDFIKDRTINNTRSSRYKDDRIANKINILFDWAENNNITPQKLVTLSNKVYKMYLDKGRKI